MESLVGYTGFVGSNIASKHKFDKNYNSKNIEKAYYTNPDMLVYAGVPAEVFYANKFPEKDLEIVNGAIQNIKKINPKKLVLISSINVYPIDEQGDENKKIDIKNLDAYGKNRRILEEWVINNYDNYLIIRLPGLFGKNIKKNFIYDLINKIPTKLTEETIKELSVKNKIITEYYINNNDGFYICKELNDIEKAKLQLILEELNFSSINFTDSRGIYQYFNLKYLWDIIEKALKEKIKILNIATEPFKISQLYKEMYNKEFINEIKKIVPNYNMKTIHDSKFGGEKGYIMNQEKVIKEIKQFVEEENETSSIKHCLEKR